MSDAICPGQKALFNNDGSHHFLRIVCTVYWQNAMPSTEVFYLHEHPFVLSFSGIADLQDDILATMKKNAAGGTTPIRAIYVGYEGVQMTPDDVTNVGWHLLSPFPQPSPEPTPEPTPSPAPAKEA